MEQLQQKQVPAQCVAAVLHQGSYDEIGSVFHTLYQRLAGRGVTPAGPPLTIFHAPPNELDWGSSEFEVCVPVPEGTAREGGIEIRSLPNAEVVSAVVEGPYSDIPARYAEFLAWIDAQGLEVMGPPREIYLRHPQPGKEVDPKTFRTEIQFPISA